MEQCSVELAVEFLGVAFHSILYYSGAYPAAAFEPRRAGGLAVPHCRHPPACAYLARCLRAARALLAAARLRSVHFALTDAAGAPLARFVFEFGACASAEPQDAYLVQLEQGWRAYLLRLAAARARLPALPEDASFSVLLHADESGAVALAADPELEDFPLVEVDHETDDTRDIIPLKKFSFRGICVETFIQQ